MQMPNETAIVFIVPNSDKQTDKTMSTYNSPDKLITLNKGNNKITELRTNLQRESQNS
jgi:hypothetical protein